VLQRLVELANYMSAEFRKTLDRFGLRRSSRRIGVSFDNAMTDFLRRPEERARTRRDLS